MPVGEKALLEYLASGAVKGVGAAMARRLLDAFGEDVLTVIEEAPSRLTEVKGISPKRAETIHQSLCMQLSMRRLLDFLSAHGLSLSLAMPLYRRYGDLALTALRANPYLLTEEPLFTPFPAADKLARELGLEADDPLRLEAGLLYTCLLYTSPAGPPPPRPVHPGRRHRRLRLAECEGGFHRPDVL